jgi:choline dehydrogenase-like flavoprotein
VAGPFNQHQLLFVQRFAEALFDGFAQMAIPIPQVVANFSKQFELIGGKPAETMKLILTVMPAFLGPDFNDKPVAHRRHRVEERLAGKTSQLHRDLARLRAVIYGAYYGHWLPGGEAGNQSNPVHQQIGFTLPKFRTRQPNEPQLTLRSGVEIPPASLLLPSQVPAEVDYVVVGSGSGGAVSAYNLAPHGEVLVVEAGPHVPSPALSFEERAMGAKLYKHGTLQTTTDNDIVIFQGRNVGGSPTVNNGICLRMAGEPLHNTTTPDPFAKWVAAGADIGAANLAAAYGDVARDLSLSPATTRAGQGNGQHLVAGWKAFAQGRTEPWIRGATPGWFPRNFGERGKADACASAGYCNTGCPHGRKNAMAQSYLPKACAAGAKILPDSKVDRILFEQPAGKSAPRRAFAVVVKVGPDRTPTVIRVRRGVVVAAGTIASSKLLDESGIEDTGKGISLNVASPVVALMPAGQTPSWDESQMTTAVDCGEFWLESHFQPPQSMSMLMGGWFGEMDRRMRHYGRLRSAGVLLPLDRRGKLSGDKINFEFKPGDVDLLRRALATLTRVHFAAGALEVWPSIRTGKAILPTDDVDAFFAKNVRTKDDATLSSAHPHGGNPIHADPKKGVVDLKCKVHGTSNVLVADASVFPACIGVNAQYTVMAVAHLATRAHPVTKAPPI